MSATQYRGDVVSINPDQKVAVEVLASAIHGAGISPAVAWRRIATDQSLAEDLAEMIAERLGHLPRSLAHPDAEAPEAEHLRPRTTRELDTI